MTFKSFTVPINDNVDNVDNVGLVDKVGVCPLCDKDTETLFVSALSVVTTWDAARSRETEKLEYILGHLSLYMEKLRQSYAPFEAMSDNHHHNHGDDTLPHIHASSVSDPHAS